MNRSVFSLALMAVIMTSCSMDAGSGESRRIIPDIDSLMAIGADARGTVQKTSKLNGEETVGNYSPGKAFTEELEVFKSVESMNLPVHHEHYIRSEKPDDSSNLLITEWVATDSAAPVRSLRLHRREGEPAIIRLAAKIRNEGMFFSKSESLLIEFDPWTGRPERYAVTGRQRIAWLKEDVYAVQAEIGYAAGK